MSAPASTVPAVKRYLADQIQDTLNSIPVPAGNPAPIVFYDVPGQYRPNDMVAVGHTYQRVVRPMAMVGSGGTGWLQEEYELEIVTDVFRAGESLQVEAYERAYQLNDVVEQVVRDDPSLGGLVIVAMPHFSFDGSEWEKDHKGYLVTIVNRLQILARI